MAFRKWKKCQLSKQLMKLSADELLKKALEADQDLSYVNNLGAQMTDEVDNLLIQKTELTTH
jgi:hypothetical protein